jgi:hypothetical protein
MARFVANVPIEIALRCIDGTRVEGRYGDRVRYTLADARTMLVPPVVAERINALEIKPGEPFQICKRKTRNGHRNSIHWQVEKLGESETQLEQDLRASLERLKAPEITRTPEIAAPPASVIPPNTFYELGVLAMDNGTRNGHSGPTGSGETPAAPTQPSTADDTPRLPDTQLAHALKTAIAAAADAETFAKTLNYNIRFSTEDVRSMGITVLIGMQQRIPR